MNCLKRIPTILICLFLAVVCFSQTKEDSLKQARLESIYTTEELQILADCKLIAGSGIRPNSSINLESKEKGYELIYFDMAPCRMDLNPSKLKRRISFKETNKDTLTIEIAMTEACCIDVLGEIEIKKNDTINLIYSSCLNYCLCHCCYSLRYQVKSLANLENLKFQLNGVDIEESENVFIIERNTIDTLEDSTIVFKHYKDDELQFERRYNKTLSKRHVLRYRNGKLIFERIKVPLNEYQDLITKKYYKNSHLIRETIRNYIDKKITTREYECGKLIQEKVEDF